MKETLSFILGYFGLQLYYTTKLNNKKTKKREANEILLDQNPDPFPPSLHLLLRPSLSHPTP